MSDLGGDRHDVGPAVIADEVKCPQPQAQAAPVPTPGEEAGAAMRRGAIFKRTGKVQRLLVDPSVSRAKFERELAAYREIEATQRKIGCWILRAEFPEVLVAFLAPQLRPSPLAFAALIDFSNYDLWPPSVTMVDPFTDEVLTGATCRAGLARRIEAPPGQPNVAAVLQVERPDLPPFVCLPGVREYHEHPAHTGDSWLLHRGTGVGTLYYIIEKLHMYGVQGVNGFQVTINNVNVSGLTLGKLAL